MKPKDEVIDEWAWAYIDRPLDELPATRHQQSGDPSTCEEANNSIPATSNELNKSILATINELGRLSRARRLEQLLPVWIILGAFAGLLLYGFSLPKYRPIEKPPLTPEQQARFNEFIRNDSNPTLEDRLEQARQEGRQEERDRGRDYEFQDHMGGFN